MSNLREAFTPNPRIAAYYAAGALLLIGLSFAYLPWTLVFLWPAASLTLVVAAYLFLGPAIYSKKNGKLPPGTWLLLWPVLLGQRLSLIHYAKRANACDRLTDHVWIGRRLSEMEARSAVEGGVSAVLDLASEFSEAEALHSLDYLQLNVLDLTAPTPSQIDQAVAFIQNRSANGIVYVHCKIGYSRTAAIAGAWLMATGRAENPEQAIAVLRRARPGIIIRREALAAIRDYHARMTPSILPPPVLRGRAGEGVV